MGKTVIHCSGLAHQIRMANALQQGFKRHGISAKVSHAPNEGADIHVVMGPWFAFNHWRYANTLYIDRAYWGDPECVSIHRLVDGEKVRTKDNPYRAHPKPQPWKHGRRILILCDYADSMDYAIYQCSPQFAGLTVRRHPSEGHIVCPLEEDLARNDVAMGKRTTALVTAAVAGLPVISNDPHSPVAPIAGRTIRDIRRPDREQWLRDLAWHNWDHDEIAKGEAWQFIRTHWN